MEQKRKNGNMKIGYEGKIRRRNCSVHQLKKISKRQNKNLSMNNRTKRILGKLKQIIRKTAGNRKDGSNSKKLCSGSCRKCRKIKKNLKKPCFDFQIFDAEVKFEVKNHIKCQIELSTLERSFFEARSMELWS